MLIRISGFILFISIVWGCVPESKKLMLTVDVNIGHPGAQRILSFQDRGLTDSLVPFLSNEDPTFRYLSALAFASHQDASVIDTLATLLEDPVMDVRAAAAFSLGQLRSIGAQDALVRAFKNKDTISVDSRVNANILEAIGKCGDKNMHTAISTVKSYRKTDTLLLEGQTRALYQFSLRGMHSPESTNLVVDYVTDPEIPESARLYAAHYLARSRDLDIEDSKFRIAQAYINETNPDIKMALVLGLKHTRDPEIETMLVDQLDLELDYRVMVNLIRTLGYFTYINSAQKIMELVDHDNLHIALEACRFFKTNGIKEDVIVYRQLARNQSRLPVKTALYDASMAVTPYYYSKTRNGLRWEIQNLYAQTEKLNDKKSLIYALAHDVESYAWLGENTLVSENTVLRTATVEALGQILQDPEFDLLYKGYAGFHRRKILDLIKNSMEVNDEGMIAAAADIIASPEAKLKTLIDSLTFLEKALEDVSDAGKFESRISVEKALAYMKDVPFEEYLPPYTHPLEFSYLQEYNESTKAIVKTDRGLITIKLNVTEAPGAVFNFIELSNRNYFDDKIFHRVVPNFVVQTGSPRGDNYGGADYTIRSNFSTAYYESQGVVGMASAGPHTESTQWFITHSPTPHLNGKYTVFGFVEEGMDVLHNLQAGDKIIDVIISNI